MCFRQFPNSLYIDFLIGVVCVEIFLVYTMQLELRMK